MWLYRGAQSAVFYYVTCTPCAEHMGRQKRKREAVRARSQREKQQSDGGIVTDQPRLHEQPTPFSTNAGWAEELSLGPGPPRRRGGHRTATHHRVESFNTGDYSNGSEEDYDIMVSHPPSQRLSKLGSRHLGDRINRKIHRYQREDEPLWGEEVEVKGSSVGLSGRGKVDARAPSKYTIPRVPPVNDLHPPIVSGPKSRAETRWMLQPPPSARVMSGKERGRAVASPVDYSKMRMESDKSASGRSVHTHTLPPLATELTLQSPDSLPKTPQSTTQDHPRPPSRSFYAYGKDESHFVISSPTYPPSDSCSSLSSTADSDVESPRESLHSPATPVSRPRSKDANNHLDVARPAVSRAMTSVQKDNKKNVHVLHFELQDAHDLGIGEIERVRPYRWSMDI
ncbi:uncharacterized protein BDV17DRAFT_211612 [Aspergillus undulatus]|uniref:uncharacterized protein n=1 Tax=Aspergillus undulatus TaxID=1810928 RepID=UPI003CCD64A7